MASSDEQHLHLVVRGWIGGRLFRLVEERPTGPNEVEIVSFQEMNGPHPRQGAEAWMEGFRKGSNASAHCDPQLSLLCTRGDHDLCGLDSCACRCHSDEHRTHMHNSSRIARAQR